MTGDATRRSISLRTQILLILLGGAILPLAIVGLWLTSSAVRSGEALLRSHLEQSAQRFVAVASSRWEYRRGDVTLVAENDASVRAVTRPRLDPIDSAYLNVLAQSVALGIPSVELRDVRGELRWASTPSLRAAAVRLHGVPGISAPVVDDQNTLRVETPVRDGTGHAVGTAVSFVALSAIIPSDSARPLVPGGFIAIKDSRHGTILVPFANSGPRAAFNGEAEETVRGTR
jgi:hypothetical protein